MAVTLATSEGGSVTMRAISPVEYQSDILTFTGSGSRKYRQLSANPNCCIATGSFYAECEAEILGPTMLEQHAALRDTYSAKFPGAFDENIAFGGRGAEFIRLKPRRLTGWAFPNDVPTPDGVPTIPFEIEIK